jgi:hypothetical protein
VTTDDWASLPIGEPARRALRNEGLHRLDDLSSLTRGQLTALHGMGPKAMGVLTERLQESGLDFAEN